MGVRILFDHKEDRACLYGSVTETAFGPCFLGFDADSQAEAFLRWLNGMDLRGVPPVLLERAHTAWCRVALDEYGNLRDEE